MGVEPTLTLRLLIKSQVPFQFGVERIFVKVDYTFTLTFFTIAVIVTSTGVSVVRIRIDTRTLAPTTDSVISLHSDPPGNRTLLLWLRARCFSTKLASHSGDFVPHVAFDTGLSPT